jgi:phosphatidylinositol alpha-mannosyltransferase
MSLKIAITSTIGWPYIRRGNRYAYELAVYLAAQGHEVHYISAKPGKLSRRKCQGNMLTKYHRLYGHPLLWRLNIHFFETFTPVCFYALIRERYDIVQSFVYPDAFAASLMKMFKGVPFVHFLTDANPMYWNTRFAKGMFTWVVKTATQLVAPSNYVNENLKKEFQKEAEIIPPPVNTEHFTSFGKKNINAHRILCTSALQPSWKGAKLLVNAFEMLLKHIPSAVLQLSSQIDEITKSKLLQSVNSETRRAIDICGVGKPEDLPIRYRNATVTVVPSTNETFGMVMLESLASGTPVVGTASGAIPEVLNDPEISILFDYSKGPEALQKSLEIAKDSRTAERCRNFAEKFSWGNLGPRYEKLYQRILGNNP